MEWIGGAPGELSAWTENRRTWGRREGGELDEWRREQGKMATAVRLAASQGVAGAWGIPNLDIVSVPHELTNRDAQINYLRIFG